MVSEIIDSEKPSSSTHGVCPNATSSVFASRSRSQGVR